MEEKDDLLKVGSFNEQFNTILGTDIELLEIFRSKGLPAHMVKRKHYKCLKYIDYIPDIISKPDYIGINPNESENSIEIVKQYDDSVLLGIKLDSDGKYLYVSTMYDVQESKVLRRLHSGRLKRFIVDKEEEKQYSISEKRIC